MFNLILSMMIGLPILCAMFGQGIDKDTVTLMIELSFACIIIIVWVFVWVSNRCTDPPVIKEVIPSIREQGGAYTGFPGKRYIEEDKEMAKGLALYTDENGMFEVGYPIGSKVYVTDNSKVYPHAKQVIPKCCTFTWGYQPENEQEAVILAKNEIQGRLVYICDTGEKVFVIGVRGLSLKEEKGVQIKIEKILKAGEQWVHVIEVQGLLGRKDLPQHYLGKDLGAVDAVWMETYPTRQVCTYQAFSFDVLCLLEEGCIYPVEEFRAAIKHIRKAGKRLSQIKAEQAIKNANWHGEAVIKI